MSIMGKNMNILEDKPMDVEIAVQILMVTVIALIAGIAIFGFVKEIVKERHDKIEKEYKRVIKEVKKR